MKKPPRRRAARRAPTIAIVIEESAWRKEGALLRLLRRAARLALKTPPGPHGAAPQEHDCGVTLLLTNDPKLRALNASFRGQDKTTNVLSFPPPPGEENYLGDIAVAYGVVSREARAQKKPFAAHAAHLCIHGILHLLGYDHEKASEARIMEGLEKEILAVLRIGDPYAPRPYTGPGKAA